MLSLVVTSIFFVAGGMNSLEQLLGITECGGNNVASHTSPSVALIDPLASESPNSRFVETVRSLAGLAGYAFDYYPPWTATMDTFIHLPEKGYTMIIIRSHVGYDGGSYLPVALTTSEPYSQTNRVGDQLDDRLVSVGINGSGYFGMTPKFVTETMCGRFPSTLVLAMGCSTMVHNDFAEAFVKKGAKEFIGWNTTVSVTWTDLIFGELVKLLLRGSSVGSAVQTVMDMPGVNSDLAKLLYYPAVPS